MLKSERLRLRAVEPEDLELMYLIENDTTLWPYGTQTSPFSHYDLRQFISENANDFFSDRQLRLTIELTDGTAIGFIDLQHYQPLHSRAEVGIVVVPEQQGKGYASEALRLLMLFSHNHLQLHQLYALVPEGNLSSERLFESCGYKKTSTLTDWIHTAEGWKNVGVYQE